MGELGSKGERFLDNKRITGAIPEILEEAIEFIKKNSRIKTIIDENGKRVDRPEYPIMSIREAVLNALIHRDYSIYSESIPITIEMLTDRIEIRNSGGLYGGMIIENLGKLRAETRNEVLVNILELLDISENRYSGIPTMRREGKNYGLAEPEFKVSRDEFIVVIRNDFYDIIDEKVNDVKEKTTEDLLEFCKTPRSREELTTFTGESRYYTMANIFKPLLKSGELVQTIPNKPKSSKQKYVSVF